MQVLIHTIHSSTILSNTFNKLAFANLAYSFEFKQNGEVLIFTLYSDKVCLRLSKCYKRVSTFFRVYTKTTNELIIYLSTFSAM